MLDKGAKNIYWRKIASSTNGAGKTGNSYVVELNLTPPSHPAQNSA